MKSDKLAVSNKLTGENLTQAINSRTVTLVRYARGRICSLEGTRTPVLYPRTRTLITNDKRRPLLTGLCGTILDTKEGWRKSPIFGGGLCQANRDVQYHIESSQELKMKKPPPLLK